MITHKLCNTLSKYSKLFEGNLSYTLAKVFDKNDIVNFKAYFKEDEYSYATLATKDNKLVRINIASDQVCLILKDSYQVVHYIINESGDLFITTFEQRPRGIIVDEEKRIYRDDLENKYQRINTVLESKRYCLTNKTINELMPDYALSSTSPVSLERFVDLYYEKVKYVIDCEAVCKTFYTSYILNNYINLYTDKKLKEYDSTQIHIFINGEEISYYDLIDHKDKLEVSHDLFMGRINKLTINEITLMSLGLIDEDAFDLYSELGYESREDLVLGSSLIKRTSKYKNYVTKMLAEKFVCNHFKIIESREDILNVIRNNHLIQNENIRVRK